MDALRHRAGVDALRLTGSETVLEIGPGQGVATRLILAGLSTGRLVAVDRSAPVAGRLSSLNTDAIASDRLRIEAAPVETLAFRTRFDAILAVNLNFDLRFRHDWAPMLLRLVRPGGRIVLAFDPAPGTTAFGPFPQSAADRLARAGCDVRLDQVSEAGLMVAVISATTAMR